MDLCIRRYQFRDEDTMSEMRVDYLDGRGPQEFGWVVEDVDRGLNQADSLDHIASVKVKGRTAIPAGTYDLELVYSGKYGADTLSLKDVPGFRYIRIHSGNDETHTEGCILPGLTKSDSKGEVYKSSLAVTWLEDTIRPILKAGKRVRVIIERDADAWAARNG